MNDLKIYRNSDCNVVGSRTLYNALEINDVDYDDWFSAIVLGKHKDGIVLWKNGEARITLESARKIAENTITRTATEVVRRLTKRKYVKSNKYSKQYGELTKHVTELETRVKELEAQLKEREEKPQTGEVSLGEDVTVAIAFLSEKITQKGYNLSEHGAFQLLRDDGFLLKSPRNYPSQKSLDMGLMIAKPCKTNPYYFQPRLTQHGLQYFVDYYLTKLSTDKRFAGLRIR